MSQAGPPIEVPRPPRDLDLLGGGLRHAFTPHYKVDFVNLLSAIDEAEQREKDVPNRI
jgi:hypothetical protein